MKALPLIVGFGGINAAGRVSMHHSYRRMVHEALDDSRIARPPGRTWRRSWAPMIARPSWIGTLIRRIEAASHFDPEAVPNQSKARLSQAGGLNFELKRRQLPAIRCRLAGPSPLTTAKRCRSRC